MPRRSPFISASARRKGRRPASEGAASRAARLSAVAPARSSTRSAPLPTIALMSTARRVAVASRRMARRRASADASDNAAERRVI
ncbi:MAG: hypothetical protein DMF82_07835 [Acidobacteria bacterium]|nr:MAG: hypothetical protein DMF82_07835 [Acidobacteriota bacterium]